MNNKKAKQIRKQAQQLTVGMPNVAYRPHEPQLLVRQKFIDDNGLAQTRIIRKGDWNPVVMLHACTRNVYKLLKSTNQSRASV